MSDEKELLDAADVINLHEAIYLAFKDKACDVDKVATALEEFDQERTTDTGMMMTVVFSDDPGRCVTVNRGTKTESMVVETEIVTTTHSGDDGQHQAEIRSIFYNASIVGFDYRYQVLRSVFFDNGIPKDEIVICGLPFDHANFGQKGEETFFCCTGVTEFIDISFHDGIVEIWFDDNIDRRIQIFGLDD